MVSLVEYNYAMVRLISRTSMSSMLIIIVCIFVVLMLSVTHLEITNMNNEMFFEASDYKKAKVVIGTTFNVKMNNVFFQEINCKRNILLLVLVTSATENVDRRNSIRKTWASSSGVDNDITQWQVIFLLGETYHQQTKILLDNEIRDHGDILQGNFIDSYRNLTLKVQSGFSWAAEFCQPQYLLKTDDDCFVNIRLITHFLYNHNTVTRNLYAGNQMKNLDVIRRDDSKWRVSTDLYTPQEYPPYASGTGYLISGDVLQRVVSAARYIKQFPVEDAYMGVIAEYLRIPLVDTGRFTLFNVNWKACNYRYFFVIHHISPDQQFVCQNFMLESETKCADQKEITRWD